MSKFLDTAITVRQIYKYVRWLIYIALPVYTAAIFLNSLNLKTGGVILNNSPFVNQITLECRNYAEQSIGGYNGSGRTTLDNFLLRGRLRRGSIDSLVNGPDLTKKCLGYSVLGGLHDTTPRDANFTTEWLDEHGDPVVTVSVKYSKTYATQVERRK